MLPSNVSKMSRPAVVRHHHRHNLTNRFQLIKTLGQGTYGKVKLAVERSTDIKVGHTYICHLIQCLHISPHIIQFTPLPFDEYAHYCISLLQFLFEMKLMASK